MRYALACMTAGVLALFYLPYLVHGYYADTAGLDIAWNRVPLVQLARGFGYPDAPKDQTFRVPLTDGRTMTLTADKPAPPRPLAYVIVSLIGGSLTILIAGFIAFRRPGIMSAALLVFTSGLAESASIALISKHVPDAVAAALFVLCYAGTAYFPNFALASFAIRFPGSRPTRSHRRAIAVVDGIVIAAFVVILIYYWYGAFRTPFGGPFTVMYEALAVMVTLAASISSFRSAKPGERSRAGLVLSAIVAGAASYTIGSTLLVSIHRSASQYPILSGIFWNLGDMVVAGVVAYAILKHRVLDISFVLNRTLVYGVTSAIVVVLLAALEFGVERLLTSLSHVEGIFVELGIAMIVIVCARLVHGRVDQVIDNLFFRKRHENERALRTFAHEAAYITTSADLTERMLHVLETHADASTVVLALGPDYAGAGENDPAMVAMRAWHRVIDLHHVQSALPGDWAYPLVARGAVLGVLVLGPKRSGEPYAPDESDAILQVAHSVAAALQVLDASGDSALSRIETLLLTLPRRIAEELRGPEQSTPADT